MLYDSTGISSGLFYPRRVGRSSRDTAQKAALVTRSLGASTRPAPVDFMRHEAATPDKPDFQGGVDSTFQKPPYRGFLLADIGKAAKNLARILF